MPRKSRNAKGRPRQTFEKLPQNTCWIENDAYDRRVYQQLRSESQSFRELEDNGGTFVPHFASLLQDVFSLLFKNNVRFHNAAEVLPSALLNERLLRALQSGGPYEFLREQTVLNEARAGLSTLLIGERLLGLIRAEKILRRGDMRDLWDIRAQENLLERKLAEHENADRLPETGLSDENKKALAKAKQRLEGELQGAEALLRHKAARLKEDLQQIESEATNRLQAEAIKVAQELEEATEEAEHWGSAIGAGHRSPPGQKLELGKRLAGNEKLKKLARMIGRMKLQAMALRKKVFERSSEEILEIERGEAIHRLLPHEMLSLHHPVLRKDFQRRYLDQELLQYSLRGIEEKGKGPIVVCLDGSSSMAGEKEIWSKAVALTLLDIARRQRRLFRSICFASADTPLQVLDLNPRDHYDVEMKNVLDLAEYFPGGGTDFETPLNAALECLKQSRFKKGDIVFITDGECQVGAEWAERFRQAKEKLGFSLFSVLIDLGASSIGTLREFSDRITTIHQLTGDEAREIFVSF
ncbi:MAG TPA: VWA domain-containing protein [Candidatus Eisenbacteria bacterium]|nr:VWA domain-containing protein [Candidatus Eisenbacteria bacterium]